MACFIFLLKTRPQWNLAKLKSLHLDLYNSRYEFYKINIGSVNSEPGGCEERLTPGTRASVRQRQGRSSAPAKLNDDEVSAGSKGIYVFLSPRRLY